MYYRTLTNRRGAVNDPMIDEQKFVEAVAVANIPTLLMVLVQLTGDERWLQAPFRPVRVRGMGDNDSGGLAEAAQHEVRAAALGAILAWRAGRPVALPAPIERHHRQHRDRHP